MRRLSPVRTFSRLAAAATLAALLIPVAIAYACTSTATLTASPATAAAGTSVTVTGANFTPNQVKSITVRWNGTNGPLLWSGTPQSDGSFQFTFAVPAGSPQYSYVSAYPLDQAGNPIAASHATAGVTVPPPAAPANPNPPASSNPNPPAASNPVGTQAGTPAQAQSVPPEQQAGAPAGEAAPSQSAAVAPSTVQSSAIPAPAQSPAQRIPAPRQHVAVAPGIAWPVIAALTVAFLLAIATAIIWLLRRRAPGVSTPMVWQELLRDDAAAYDAAEEPAPEPVEAGSHPS